MDVETVRVCALHSTPCVSSQLKEFPSVAQAKAWWNSPEYAQAKAIRQETARTQMILVEGV